MSHEHHEPQTEQEYHETLVEHDEWFRHSAAEPHHKPAQGSTQARIIMAFFAGTIVVVFATAFAVLTLFDQMALQEVHRSQELRTPLGEITNARAAWERQLSEFSPVEGAPGRARVPLALAQRLVIDDYRTNGSHSQE